MKVYKFQQSLGHIALGKWRMVSVELPEAQILTEQMTSSLLEKKIKSYDIKDSAKLQKIAKGGKIIIGENAYLQSHGNFQMEKKIKLHIKNKADPIVCYQVAR